MHIKSGYLFWKIQCVLCNIVFFFFLTTPGYAQESLLQEKINVDFKNITLRKAFKQIEKQLKCYFTFESPTIDNQKKITLSLIDIPLETGLDRMLNDSTLVYKVVDNHVIIRKKNIVRSKKELPDSIPGFYVVRGTIVDEINGNVLPFSTVSIFGYSLGAIANAQGEFILKIPKRYFDQQICVSHIGYKNFCFPLQQMVGAEQIFKLQRSFISIQEVIIRKTDARALIKAAIKKRPKNYSVEPVYLTGFYRESVKRRDKYMFFSEAVVQIYKSSYVKKFDGDMIKVLKARKMKSVSAEDTVSVKLKSGLYACLELDIVKNLIDFLVEENFDNYNFNMSDIITYNDRNVYLIEFEQKEHVNEALYMGKIYIDIEKLAIVGAEFSVNSEMIKKAQSNYIAKKKRGIKLKMTSIAYMINYRLIDSTYYMNYVRGLLKMKVRKRKKLFPINFETSFELAVNEIDTLDIKRFKRKESENLRAIFFDDVHQYDESFWEHYNFIKPDEPLQEAIQKYGSK